MECRMNIAPIDPENKLKILVAEYGRVAVAAKASELIGADKIGGTRSDSELIATIRNHASPEKLQALIECFGPSIIPEQKITTRHEQALLMASHGLRVFPVRPNSKRPIHDGWQAEATTDTAKIDQWFADTPKMNYGIAFDDQHFAIDLDTKGGKNGLAQLAKLEGEHGPLPDTLAINTPSGGLHLYFAGSGLRNSVGKKSLADDKSIDIRARGGYVLGPGSVIDGKAYEVAKEAVIAKGPQWFLSLAQQTAHEPEKRRTGIELDAPSEVAKMRAYLQGRVEQGDVAIEFCSGNDRTYKLACLVMDFVSPEKAQELIEEMWNPACQPPWPIGTGAPGEQNTLTAICKSAAKHRQNEIGSKASLPPNVAFAGFVANQETISKTEEKPGLTEEDRLRHFYRLRSPVEEANRPPLEFWDEHKLFIKSPEGAVVVPYGGTGVHKTGLTLSKAIDLIFNHPSKPRVAYFAGEGSYAFGQARVGAACSLFGKTVEELAATGQFHQISAAPLFSSDLHMKVVLEVLAPFRPNIIVIDTLTRAMPGENFSHIDVMTKAFAVADALRRQFNALIIIIHHEGKDADKGAIGSSLLSGNADTVLYLRKLDDQTVTVDVEKMRDGQDGFTVGYRVQRFNSGVPALSPMKEDELRTAEKSNKSQLIDELSEDKFRWALFVRKVRGKERARPYKEIAEVLAGERPRDMKSIEFREWQGRANDIARKIGRKIMPWNRNGKTHAAKWGQYAVQLDNGWHVFLAEVEFDTIQKDHEAMERAAVSDGGLKKVEW
jgi:hypothetical protein